MNYWMCDECDYVFEAETPPDTCPSCHAKCTFSNVTCYIPECGGPDHLDMRLVAQRAAESKKKTI
jgi:rubredoxin